MSRPWATDKRGGPACHAAGVENSGERGRVSKSKLDGSVVTAYGARRTGRPWASGKKRWFAVRPHVYAGSRQRGVGISRHCCLGSTDPSRASRVNIETYRLPLLDQHLTCTSIFRSAANNNAVWRSHASNYSIMNDSF